MQPLGEPRVDVSGFGIVGECAGTPVFLGRSTDSVKGTEAELRIGEKLMPVALAIRVARSTMRIVRQNFPFAIGYNGLAVPLALAGLVTPLIAAVAIIHRYLPIVAQKAK